jgi:pSer/pThr/pTyr-binding forkhead associated (FHA) protein
MSLKRLVYYSAIIGGWSAFLGWLISRVLFGSSAGRVVDVVTAALVGSAIGAGLNLVAGMANAQWRQLLKRLVPGLITGAMGGAIGGFIGNLLIGSNALASFNRLGLLRAIGWMVMGAGIGVVEGIYERSGAKLRNGLIGGAIGGLVAGFLFEPISFLTQSSSGMTSAATGFVILGLLIGTLIGLVKVAFREAWLTVLDGYRPGRQLILAEASTVLGRAEYVTLPFMGRSDTAEVDAEHARIVHLPDGQFALEDNNSRTGVRVNNVRVNDRVILKDGDVIRLGMNMIGFNERQRRDDVNDARQTNVSLPQRPTARVATGDWEPAASGSQPPAPDRASPKPAIAVPPPRPMASAQPSPKPAAIVPPPRPASPAAPRPAQAPAASKAAGPLPDGMIACPSCGRGAPKGQRYCIVCDLNF